MINPNVFAQTLQKNSPDEYSLHKMGLSKEFIEELTGSYICIPRQHNVHREFDNYLDNLFFQFDLSNIEIGLITFLNEILENDKYFQFGNLEEQDLLVLNATTNQIVILDYFDHENILWYCADKPESFFEAMLLLSELFTKRSLSEDDFSTITYIDKIVKVAGGVQYGDFYKMLLGE